MRHTCVISCGGLVLVSRTNDLVFRLSGLRFIVLLKERCVGSRVLDRLRFTLLEV